MDINKIYNGHCLDVLKTFPNESVNCCVTSPPYWALRDYGHDNQLGLESTFDEYINKLCNIFDEVKRVLRKDGTCWVVIGDTYYTKSGSGFVNDNLNPKSKEEIDNSTGINKANELRGKNPKLHKCLSMIPFRFSIEMVNRGWILRNTIIWYKPNCMPASVKDRFTVDFEYVFFFVKNKKYWFEQQFEECQEVSIERAKYGWNCDRANNRTGINTEKMGDRFVNPQGRNKRAVWQVTTKPFKEAHFAVYPPELIEPMIKAGCPEDGIVLDPFMGSGTTAVVASGLNRNYIGIELNQEYIGIAEARIYEATKQLTIV